MSSNNDNTNKYIEELKAFCAQPSVSAENRGMQEMVNIVEGKLKDLGADVKRVTVEDSFPFLLAELKAKTNSEKKKTVLIYNHYDVQPEEPVELWETPPFEPTEKDGKLYVRGVSDNKGNMLLRIQAVRELLAKFDNDLPVNIKWLIEGEEEIGSPHLHGLQHEYGDFWKDSDVCIWETGGVTVDGAPTLTLGMKGILYIELECAFNDHDLHSGNAVVVDSPVWRLISALSTLRDKDGNVTLEGFYENVLAPSAKELELLEDSSYDPIKTVASLGAEKTLVRTENTLEFRKQLYFRGTANICGIWAGYTVEGGIKTVLPNKATAKIDFRLIPNQNSDDILDKLNAHLVKRGFNDITVRKLISEECGKSNIEDPSIQTCIAVMTETYGVKPQIGIINPASGPIYPITSVYDIPVVQIGASHPGSNAHAPNENIVLEHYVKAIECFKAYLKSLGAN